MISRGTKMNPFPCQSKRLPMQCLQLGTRLKLNCCKRNESVKQRISFQGAIKMLLRSHNLDVLREERKLYWKSIYLRLEASSTSSVVQTSRSVHFFFNLGSVFLTKPRFDHKKEPFLLHQDENIDLQEGNGQLFSFFP